MFEYLLLDGTALPENEVIKLALQKGLTADEYIKKNKLTLRPKQKKAEAKKEVTKPEVKKEEAVVKTNTPKIDLQSVPGVTDFGTKITEANKAFNFSKKGQTEEYTTDINEKYKLQKEKAKAEQKSYEEEYGDDSQKSIDKRNELLKIRDIEEPASVHPWQLKGQDVDIVPKLNEKLNAIGIEVENNQLSDAIVLKPIGYTPNQDGSNLDVPLSLNVGNKDNAEKINEYISLYKNDNYLNEVKTRQKGKFESYKKAVTPQDLSHDQLVKRIEETKKKKFLSISLEKGTEGGEGAAFAKEVTEKDFSNPIEFRQYKDWLAGKKMDTPSPGELIMYDQQYKDGFINKKSSAYASSLNKNDRKDFEILTQDIKKQGDLNIYKFKKEAETFNQASKDYNKLQDAYKKNPSVENKDILVASYIDLVKTQNQLQDKEASIRKYEKDYKNFVAPSITNFSANYSRLAELTTGFKGLVSSTGVALSELAGVIETTFTDRKMEDIRKRDVFGVYDLARSLNKEKQTYQKAIGVDNITSVSDAGRWLAGSSINAIPSLSMALTGQAALPLFFATGFGGKAEQFIAAEEEAVSRLKENVYLLDNTEDPAQQAAIQKQIDKDKEILAIPEWKKVTAETIYGAAEVVFEKLGTLEIMKGISKAAKYLPKKSLVEGVEWGLKNVLKTFNKEGMSEVATQAVDNAVDTLFLGENKSLFDGFVETYAQGGLVGGALAMIPSTNVIGQAYRSEVATKKEQKEIAEIVNKISKLTNVPGYNLNQALPLGRLTNEVQAMVDKLTARKDGIYEGMNERLSRGLTLAQLKEVGDINRQARDINNDLKNASLNSEISPSQLKELQDQYREDFTKLIEQKENILGDPNIKADNAKAITSRNFKFDTTAGYAFYNQRMASESLQGVVNNFKTLGTEQKIELYSKTREKLLAENKNADISDNNVRKVAFEDYKNNHYKDLILKGLDNSKAYALDNNVNVDFEVFETEGSENLVKQYENSDEYAMATPATRKAMVAELKSGNIDATNLTFNGKPKVLIDLSVASKNLRTGVASHELLHVIVENKFKNNESSSKGKALLYYIENKDKDLFALVSQRIKNSYTKKGKNKETLYDKEEEIIKDDNYYLEVLNAMSDLAADGRKLKPTTINQVRNFLNGILPKDFQFSENEGADVYSFIRDFNKAAHFGGKTKYNAQPLINVNPEDEDKQPRVGGQFSKTKVDEIQKKIDKLEDQYDNDEIEYDYYENQISLYEEQLEKAKLEPEPEKPKVEKPKVAVTEEDEIKAIIKNEKGSVASDKVQQIYDKEGTEGGYAIIELFRPITMKIVNRRKGTPGFEEKLLRDEIETGAGGIYDLIRSYDFTLGVPLAAYINKWLPYRAIAASKRRLDKEFSKDASEEKGLMATETADQNMTERVAEKPTYKNALEANVFSEEVLQNMSNKIMPHIRALTARIDTSITINRKVSPLITEITKAIGKELDIIIKKEMGGKKDDQFKGWLVKNKKYILENMTTTWLMGKDGNGGIPQAIQKQINGKWVSFPDWVGIKPARESVNTDNAGRTAGHGIVRRLPNVSKNISNETLIAQFYDSNGETIRGRKESLAETTAKEAAVDIINDDLAEEGPIFEALATNQERLGYEMINNFAATFSQQSERGNIKFSKSIMKVLDEINNLPESTKLILTGQDGNKFIKYALNVTNEDEAETNFYNIYSDDNFSTEETNIIINAVKNLLSYYKKAQEPNIYKKIASGPKENESFENYANRKVFNAMSKDLSISTTLGIPLNSIQWNSAAQRKAAQENMKNFHKNAIKYLVKNKTSKAEANKLFTRLFSRGFSYGKDQSMFEYQETFYKAFLEGIEGFDLSNVKNGRTITYNGKKVNSEIGNLEQKAKAPDIAKYLATGNAKNIEYSKRKDLSDFAKKDLKSMMELLAGMKKADAITNIQLGLIFKSLGGSMVSPLKIASELRYVADIKGYSKNPKDWVYEHVPPTAYITRIAIGVITGESGMSIDEFMDNVMNNAYVTILPKSVDNIVNSIYKSTMPFYYKTGNNPLIRYFDVGFNGYEIPSLKDLSTGKKINEPIKKNQFYSKKEIDTQGAVTNSFKFSKSPQGISVFDFDDTTGITKGSVLYTMPDGSKGKLNAEEFAKEGGNMLDAGAVFDFSEFSKIVDGKPGPMVEKMKKMIGKFGPENFFILTARPANAAGPIHEFLSSIGIDIPLENITGLGNSTAQAKADWMVGKAAEGYNDFYFSDDAIQNVKAVKDALDVLDVKSKIQQAKLKFSKTLNSRFNDILQENVGLDPKETFSDILAKRKGKAIGKYRFFVPPSAADFELLLYDFLGRGKVGENQYKFFSKALLEPYSNGIALIDAAKQSIKNDYLALKKAFPEINKNLGKLTPDGNFTYDQALRVSMWNSTGTEIPGLDQNDIASMVNFVNNDASLSAFKAGLIATGRQGAGWIEPSEYWDAETIISDLHNITEKLGRKKYLAEFVENSKEIFSPENLNRIEVIYGSNFREALEDSLYRMINGTNREAGTNRLNAAWLNWINNSTAAIMFFNTKSALLQTIGSINYLNWRENNPLNAALAFANQPQYWKDFSMIFNSDKIKERRSGLKEDVTSAEIANAAEGSKNKASAVISYLLKKGFMPTQIADSFAIGIGGASFYRNKVNAYLKQGMELDEAEAQAWKDFSKVTDETQQSGDPRDISQQQASVAGRLVLAFQNTAMQQARLIKKAGLDLINGRGDAKTNISKIVYYTAIQNTIFGGLQIALFTVLFDDDDEEDKKKKAAKDKWIDIGNGTVDTLLRGSGLGGAIIATLKNVARKYIEEKEKGFKADYGKVLIEAANIAPPLGSKFQKGFGAMRTAEFEKDVIKERGWSVTQNGKLNLSPSYSVLGQAVEATTNFPLNRLVTKVNNISEALDSRNKSWQRIAVALGYKPYIIGAKDEEGDIIKAGAKLDRKEAGIKKIKETRIITRDSINKLSPEDFKAYVLKKKTERLAVKDSINRLPKAQLDKYLAEKEASKLFTSKQKEVLKEIKRDSLAGLSKEEYIDYLIAVENKKEIAKINRKAAKIKELIEREKKRNIYK